MSGYDGYDSGFSDDRYAEAERLRQRDESRKIVIALWPEQMQPNLQGQSPGCEFCPGRVLVVSKKDPNAYICGDCGNLTAINPTTTKQKPRFKPKQNATPSLIIASQSRKRKKKSLDGISDDSNHELRKELAALGVIDSASASDVKEY